jgi:hypothetical protein
MQTLQIPEPFVAGLVKIGQVDDAHLQKLGDALPDLPVSVHYDELVGFLSSQVKEISKEDLHEILKALIGLVQGRLQLNKRNTEIVTLVCTAMERSDNPRLAETAKKCDDFGDRLVKLLDTDSLVPLAKAADIVTDHDCVFLHATTRSDIRAVFGEEIENLPKAAAIIHMLDITYQRNERRESFYIALNSQDIATLIDALNRAISKEKGLKKMLEAANVTSLDTE